jgi:site-specific DNA recombinase
MHNKVTGREQAGDDEVLEWVCEALDASHADERREHEEAIKRLRAEYDRLQNRIHAMYVDKLDGKVDGVFFERMSGEWRGEQDRCQREIERHQTADQSYLEEGVRILELARNAQRLFENQEPREKRRLLNFLVSNCSWKGGELSTILRQPFDLLLETTAFAAQATRDGRHNLTKSEIWLPGPDSNQRPTG